MTKTITYALRDKTTGELVRYETQSNEGGYSCVASTITLVTARQGASLPVYEQASLRKVGLALAADTPWYNADYDTPRHGGDIDLSSIEIVRREVTEELVPQDYAPPLTLTSRVRQEKPISLLRRYAGEPGLELPGGFGTFAVFELPDGESIESIRLRAAPSLFQLENYGFYVLSAVFEVPEDYVPDLKGKPGFAAVIRDAELNEVEDSHD